MQWLHGACFKGTQALSLLKVQGHFNRAACDGFFSPALAQYVGVWRTTGRAGADRGTVCSGHAIAVDQFRKQNLDA